MAYFTITEDEEKGERIPSDSQFTIVSVDPRGGSRHGHSEVILRGRATQSIGVNLDPGVYRVKVNALNNEVEEDKVLWGRTFTVGGDTEEMKRLAGLKPKWARAINTSDGARWNCQFPGGCNYKATSIRGAVVHEYKAHLGMDPLKANAREAVARKAAAPMVREK